MASTNNQKPATALLVGRANVGKSTLFNRLLNKHQAITSPQAGTTRDLNRALLDWRDKSFWLIDSGGFNRTDKDDVNRGSQRLLQKALQEASVIIHLVDGQTGLTPEDRELARQIRRLKAHHILAINKMDSLNKRVAAAGISLGYPDTVMVSAHTGSGVGDLLDIIWKNIASAVPPNPNLRMAFIGQTNVGKSSLFNALLKNDRSLVLASPHTTRDKVKDYLENDDITIELIDTAGLRRQHNRAPALEKQSGKQSLGALQQIDLALITLDGSLPFSWQDQHIAQQIIEAKTACIVLLNKSDLVNTEQRLKVEKNFKYWFPMLLWAPKLWVSALKGEGLKKLLPLTKEVENNWRRTLTEDEINSFRNFLTKNKVTRGLPLVAFDQQSSAPPSFQLTIKQKTNPPIAVADWTAVQLRKKFGFLGSPLRVRIEATRQVK